MLWASPQACAEESSELLHSQAGEMGWDTPQWTNRATAESGTGTCWGCVLTPRTIPALPVLSHFTPLKSVHWTWEMRKAIFLLSKFSGREHVVPKLLEVVAFRNAAKFSPTLVRIVGGGLFPGLPWEGLGEGGQRSTVRPGCEHGPFCRRWQNEWASVLSNYWWASR